MARRSTLPPDTTLPEGWTAHDGSGCPLSLDSMPAVMFRSGTRILPQKFTADHWEAMEGGSCWEWQGRPEDGFDIIGWRK